MSARPFPARAALPAHPLTVAGALLLAASELRYLAGWIDEGNPLPEQMSALLAHFADECEQGSTSLRATDLEVERVRLLSRAMGDLVDDYQQAARSEVQT
jgi:hypothetical protein